MAASNATTYALFPDSCCIKSGCNMGKSETDYVSVSDVHKLVSLLALLPFSCPFSLKTILTLQKLITYIRY